jgi:hypothetical protein
MVGLFQNVLCRSENQDGCHYRVNVAWGQVHQKVSRFFGPRYIGDDYFLGPNIVSFNRAVVSDVRERVRDFRITFALYVRVNVAWGQMGKTFCNY